MDQKLNLFQLLTSQKIISEKQVCSIKIYEHGDNLFKEGEDIVGFFLIKKGSIKITKNLHENEKLDLFSLTSGDMVGDIAFSGLDKYYFNAEVNEKSIVIYYDYKKLDEFLKNNLDICVSIYFELAKVMSKNIRQINVNFRNFFMWSLKGKK